MSSNLKKKNCQTLKRKIVLKSKSRRRSRWPRWCSATCRSRRSWPWWGWCRPAGPSQAGRREFSCQGERGGSCREARETGPSGAQLSGEGSGAVAFIGMVNIFKLTDYRLCCQYWLIITRIIIITIRGHQVLSLSMLEVKWTQCGVELWQFT